jgi:hypothetical protein
LHDIQLIAERRLQRGIIRRRGEQQPRLALDELCLIIHEAYPWRLREQFKLREIGLQFGGADQARAVSVHQRCPKGEVIGGGGAKRRRDYPSVYGSLGQQVFIRLQG